MKDLTGQSIGQYQVSDLLGVGGMAQVYKARQPGLDRDVAIKLIRPELATDNNFKIRFEREAKAIARLSHGNIVHVYEFGVEAGRYYLVMEFIEGETLKAYVAGLKAAGQKMALSETLSLMQQVAQALDYAHQRGIIHRDVKPDNIMLTTDGRAVLNDFGIAKMLAGQQELTATGLVIGTPTYMSPEQAKGEKDQQGPASDLYSLGVILYELAVGEVPFKGTNLLELVYKHGYEPIPPPRSKNPALPASLEAILIKALAKSPSERYQRGQELIDDLEEVKRELARSSQPKQAATTVISIEPASIEPASTEPASVPFLEETTRTWQSEDSSSPKSRSWRITALLGGLFLLVVASVWLLFNNGFFTNSDTIGQITYSDYHGRVYRIEAREGATPQDVSAMLDELAEGSDDVNLNVSANGAWFVIQTARFDPECVAWACLAVIKGDFSTGDAVRVKREVVRAEERSAISSHGNLIVYSAEGEGDHIRDLWSIRREAEQWQIPLRLSTDSPYAWNYLPALSHDEQKVVFSCGNEPYRGPGTAICEVNLDGSNFKVMVKPTDGPAPDANESSILQYPHYAPDGRLIFIASWDGQTWQLPLGATEPIQVVKESTVCTLPDGRLITTSWHETDTPLKLIAADYNSDFTLQTGVSIREPATIGCGEMGP